MKIVDAEDQKTEQEKDKKGAKDMLPVISDIKALLEAGSFPGAYSGAVFQSLRFLDEFKKGLEDEIALREKESK